MFKIHSNKRFAGKSPNPKVSGESNANLMEPMEEKKRKLKAAENLFILTWTEDFGVMYAIGTDIYSEIFNVAPEAFFLFPKFSQYPGDEWKDSKEFRNQALKFVQTLSKSIQNLDRLETAVDPFLFHVGKLHCKLAAKGFMPTYWDVFESAIRIAMKRHIDRLPNIESETKSQAVEAWVLLANYIIERMKEGFVAGTNPTPNLPDANRNSQNPLSPTVLKRFERLNIGRAGRYIRELLH